MIQDPFQTYATLGSYYGMPTPFGLPHPALQGSGINPAAINPLATLGFSPFAGGFQQAGQSPFGQYPGQGQIGPQQLQQLQPQQLQQQMQQQIQQQQQLQQLVSALALQAALPQLLAALVNNPLISAGLHPSGIGSNFGQQYGQQPYSPYQQAGQIGSPFGQQFGSPFGQSSPFGQQGYPLAPQSWVGQGGPFGGGQGFGPNQQSQWGQRPFQSPWGY